MARSGNPAWVFVEVVVVIPGALMIALLLFGPERLARAGPFSLVFLGILAVWTMISCGYYGLRWTLGRRRRVKPAGDP